MTTFKKIYAKKIIGDELSLNNIADKGITISNTGIISLTAPTYDATQNGKILSLQSGVLTLIDSFSK